MEREDLLLISATNIPQLQYFGMMVKNENIALRQLTVNNQYLNTQRNY
jgi:hypothetical protein